MGTAERILFMLLCFATIQFSSSITNSQDAAALLALMVEMKNTPPNWGESNDPCGAKWTGVTCKNSRVTELKLYNMGLEGTLSSDIGSLTELWYLDLSYNKKLGGPLTPAIGNLKHLTSLFLLGCSFSGRIPNELGNLEQLQFLDLNLNQFTGEIPASLGTLSNLLMLDLAENQLTGSLPVSTNTTPGLDQLVNAMHFHLNKNQLSGTIPEKLFSSKMKLVHILLDRNQLTGSIPESIGLVKTLVVLQIDNNFLNGSVPSSISNLTSLNVLNLANNTLTGPFPNLTGMNALYTLDLSNNSFDPSEAPAWFSELGSLTSLVIESGGLYGEVPQKLFSFPKLQQVILKSNRFNGSLDIGSNISQQLQIVDFQNNNLTAVELTSIYNNTILLTGNPVCSNVHLSQTSYCLIQQEPSSPYSGNCAPQSCTSIYDCPHPYEGVMVFRAPFFRVLKDNSVFQLLLVNVWTKYRLALGSVSVQNPIFDDNSYLQVELKFCPSTGIYFNRSEILTDLDLSHKNYKPPEIFGPFYFIAFSYPFPVGGSSRVSRGLIAGEVAGCTVLVLGLVTVGMYALTQKKRAQRAIEITNPFASWETNEDTGGAPNLKGARFFSFDEIKKYTNNFPEINEIGSGGFGKVYRGMLPDGQVVAIKRSQIGSNQGGLEFKTEIELLSRVHHKNLVGLVGFCFQRGEQMLVYEYISNGTLRACLSGRAGIQLDWKRRLWIALGSARGLAYLHEHAYPPIIHRDIKSTNILLDENLNAKVADFGLSKLISDHEREYVSSQVKGTMGYLDPEYYMTQQLTEKSDVYSFGVVMLELVTSMPPVHKGQYVVCKVKMAIDQNDEEYFGLKDIMDPVIRDVRSPIGFTRFVELALHCVQDSSEDRPTMSYIVKEIERILNDDGVDGSFASVSSSTRDFGVTKVAPQRDYIYSTEGTDISTSSFSSRQPYSQASTTPDTR